MREFMRSGAIAIGVITVLAVTDHYVSEYIVWVYVGFSTSSVVREYFSEWIKA